MKVDRQSRFLKVAGSVLMLTGAAGLVSSCGGGGDGGSEVVVVPPPTAGAATIDTAGVNKALADFGGLVSVCQDGTGAVQGAALTGMSTSVKQALALMQGQRFATPTKHALALGGTAPADQLGSCGGRFGYRNYSHLNGVTTASLAFENYCQSGAKAGDTQTVNGSIAFVNTATPTASGPITTQIDANSSNGVTTVTKNAAGATLTAETVAFTGFKMVVGVPGGTPTAAKPDVMSIADMTIKNDVTGKTYRQTGYSVSGFEEANGNSQWSMTGRGYRSDGSYYDLTTPQPIVQNASGDTVSGQFRFAGSNGSNAVATVVPGSVLQVKLSVNGTAMSSLPACVK